MSGLPPSEPPRNGTPPPQQQGWGTTPPADAQPALPPHPYPQTPPPAHPSGAYPPQYQLGYGTPQTVPPKTHLVDAIIVTVCCCVPFGIVAIVYAAMAKSSINGAHWDLAREYAGKARMWTWIALAAGLIGNGAYVALMIFTDGNL